MSSSQTALKDAIAEKRAALRICSAMFDQLVGSETVSVASVRELLDNYTAMAVDLLDNSDRQIAEQERLLVELARLESAVAAVQSLATKSAPLEVFPIQGERGGWMRTIPWPAIAPFEGQAWTNHGQTLKRLAERGGLSPCEAVAVLEGRSWRPMPWADAVLRLDELVRSAAAPIEMVLHCPGCGAQHVDAPEPEKDCSNPPHRSHLCHACGVIWRPADVATTGVAAVATRGDRDTWPPAAQIEVSR